MAVTEKQAKQARFVREAAQRLVSQMDKTDADLIAPKIGAEIHGSADIPGPVPMWSTLFRVSDSCDERRIRELLCDPFETDESAREYADRMGMDGADLDAQAIREMLENANYDDVCLYDAGWRDVGDTGLLAIEVEGDIFLGVNSAGHDFFDAYWIPLYRALGYSWHEQMEREESRSDAVRELVLQVHKLTAGKGLSRDTAPQSLFDKLRRLAKLYD